MEDKLMRETEYTPEGREDEPDPPIGGDSQKMVVEDKVEPYDNTQNSSYLDLYSQQVL